eukprot:gb/GFBE01076999.1/.p1 GENE.gb/GFBE01076999.1/~~gb/GFBE01076999.1/.p1  ORF type:complete len:311 (+),score=98.48 gb/GFBE01076999.1/:1-933(+)
MPPSADPSLECTWKKLSDKIVRCEYLTVAAGLKAEEYVEKENKRFDQVMKRREEMMADHEKALAQLKKEHDSSLRGVVNKANQDTDEVLSVQQDAAERCRVATKQAEESERHVYVLEKEVKRLYCLLDKLNKEVEQQQAELMEAADREVQDKFEEHDAEVRDVSLFAQEVHEDAFMTIERMQENIRSSAEVAHAMAQSRSRYQQLYQVASSRATEGITEKDFQKEKRKIMEEWHGKWQGHCDTLTPGPPSLAQVTASRLSTPMTPSSRNRPRSVQLNIGRAMQRMQSPISCPSPKNALPPVPDTRPKTAP